MRRTKDYVEYELMDGDVGTLLERCLSEMAEEASSDDFPLDETGEPHEEVDCDGIAKNKKYLRTWNPSKEELARWCTLLYSQWLLGKFEDDMEMELESEKNAAVRKYLDARTPQIFAYIEAGCPGYGNR